MKKLIIHDHLGNKLLVLDAFVEGQDLHWKSFKPMAFWLGTIDLVDKEPEPEIRPLAEIIEEIHKTIEVIKEVTDESKKANNQSTGEQRLGEASEHEGIESISKNGNGEQPPPRDKWTRKRKAA